MQGQLEREPLANDLWQDEVIRGIIEAYEPKLQVVCDHPPVHPQAAANCLIEAVNKQVAQDLGVKEENLTGEDVKNVRLKVNQALHLTLPALPISQEVHFIEQKPQVIIAPNIEPAKIDQEFQPEPIKETIRNQSDLIPKEEAPAAQPLTAQEESRAKLIQEQLVVLTQKYLDHLSKEEKKLNPQSKDAAHLKKYQNTRDKCFIVNQLMKALITKETSYSKNIANFHTVLDANNTTMLKKHRDPMWKQYFKNCMVILAVVLSGLIPGMIGLLGYASYKHKSSPLFFTKSQGEEYADKSSELIKQMNPSPSVKK